MEPKIRIAALAPEDVPALEEFHRKAWNISKPVADGTSSTKVAVAPETANPFANGSPAPVSVVFAGDSVVGYLGSIPTQFCGRSTATPAHWIKGFMVLEEYRNGPLGLLLIKQMMKQVSLSAAMVVAPAARRLFEAMGFRDVGTVPNYIRLIRPANVLRAVDPDKLGLGSLPKAVRTVLRIAQFPPIAWSAGAAGRLCMAALDGLARLRSAGLRADITAAPPPQPQIDPVWARLQAASDFVPCRHGAYVHWRYAGENLGRYEFIAVRRGESLTALAVVRRPQRTDDPRLAGLQVGLVVDLIADPADTASLRRALLAAQQWGRKSGCDALLLTISHGAIRRILASLGYVKIPGNVHFLLRTPGEGSVQPASLASSWVTRGDAWGDDI